MEPQPDVGEGRSRQAIELVDELGWSEDPIVGTAHLALGGGLVSRSLLEEGESWLDRGGQPLDGLPDPEASVSLPYARGVLRFRQHRFEEAIECFCNTVARPLGGVPAPHFPSSSARAWELRAGVRLGDLESARLALAEDGPKQAVEALAPVLEGSAAALHVNYEVEALVLGAIARDRLGQAAAAEDALEAALDLAEPGRQVWTIFTQPGARPLLERHRHHRTAHRALIAELLDRFTGIEAAGRSEDAAELREPLTDRELDVLRLLPTHLSAGEIANELSLSVHTVKTHTRSIYGKLDVHRRSEAVEQALALVLLPVDAGEVPRIARSVRCQHAREQARFPFIEGTANTGERPVSGHLNAALARSVVHAHNEYRGRGRRRLRRSSTSTWSSCSWRTP